jgi:hypothetical protein
MNLENKNKTLVDKIHKKSKCARSSARTYASTIRRIGDQFADGFNIDLKFLHKPDILEKIKKLNASLAVKRNLSNGVIVGLKLEPHIKLDEKYHAYLLELNKKVDTQAKSGLLSDKQSAKMISWDKIVKLRKLLAKKMRLIQAMNQKMS